MDSSSVPSLNGKDLNLKEAAQAEPLNGPPVQSSFSDELSSADVVTNLTSRMKSASSEEEPVSNEATLEAMVSTSESALSDGASTKRGAHSKSPQKKDSEQALGDSLKSGSGINSPKSQHQLRTFDEFRTQIHSQLRERINFAAAHELGHEELKAEIRNFVFDVASETNAHLNAKEQQEVADSLVDDMIGLGPLESLLADETITDIMVNSAKEIFIERKGQLYKTEVSFVDENHLLQIARRIANRIGRRIDEASPMVDARLEDGSRVNIIVPPLALEGTSISIRKFSRDKITLDEMITQGNLSATMACVLKVAAACRLNILVSGGTGSGKTTLLNALSKLINPKERIITIEDAAELQLQQPHVVRLESRPANIEGEGEITIRDLIKNSLRMRPDRIIVGEVRGDETIDMMQAMNTGHDGSMSTIHANRPREALSRLENMVSMAGMNMPTRVIRSQIVGAINLIVHLERMRDGVRRITSISEISGIDEDLILIHDIFTFEYDEEQVPTSDTEFSIQGDFVYTRTRPLFYNRAKYFGLANELEQALREAEEFDE